MRSPPTTSPSPCDGCLVVSCTSQWPRWWNGFSLEESGVLECPTSSARTRAPDAEVLGSVLSILIDAPWTPDAPLGCSWRGYNRTTHNRSAVLLKPCSHPDGKISAAAPQDICGTPQAGYSFCFSGATICAALTGTVRRACCTPFEASRRKKHRPSQPARSTSPVSVLHRKQPSASCPKIGLRQHAAFWPVG